MTDSNGLPTKVYRKMLTTIYKQNVKDAQIIKDNWFKDADPILQRENRYFSPRTRGNILTQEYLKKMAQKPEKPHIKRIPLHSSFASGPTVIKEEKSQRGIRINPKLRKNQSSMSAPKIDINHKHMSKNNYYKYFYLDNFNSVKQNQNDINYQNQVSNNKINMYLNINIIIEKI